jgi:two-component system nitrate/nitrite response regulator NarL
MNLASPATQSLSLAILEAQRVLRDSLAELLRTSGFQVRLAAGTAEELLGGIAVHPPALLLVDLRLHPGHEESSESGWQTIRFVRQWYPDVRVLVLTSSRDPADLRRAQQEGVAGYLHKDSVGLSELVDVVGRVGRGENVFPIDTGLLVNGDSVAPPEVPEALRGLTHRELQVLRYVAAGFDNLKISACMNISERTVRSHVSNLYRKLGPENRAQLALLARELGVRPARE